MYAYGITWHIFQFVSFLWHAGMSASTRVSPKTEAKRRFGCCGAAAARWSSRASWPRWCPPAAGLEGRTDGATGVVVKRTVHRRSGGSSGDLPNRRDRDKAVTNHRNDIESGHTQLECVSEGRITIPMYGGVCSTSLEEDSI